MSLTMTQSDTIRLHNDEGDTAHNFAKSLIRWEEGTSEEITHVEKEKERNSRVSKIFVRFPMKELISCIVCLMCLV